MNSLKERLGSLYFLLTIDFMSAGGRSFLPFPFFFLFLFLIHPFYFYHLVDSLLVVSGT